MDIVSFYKQTRDYTNSLCNPLKPEDYPVQIADFASPPKWHLAHTTWFFEEFILTKHSPDYKVFDPSFGFLFNSYYNHVGERNFRSNRGLSRPYIDSIYDYRSYVDKHMVELLNSSNEKIRELVILGINHEQQHQELLITDIKYNLSQNPSYPIYKENFDLVSSTVIENKWLKFEEGVYEIGHYDPNVFCYDNELGRHKVYLQNFELSSSLVTNGEFIEFIADQGYTRFDLWLDEAWSWIKAEGINKPLYWQLKNGEWHQFTLGGLKKIEKLDALSHINFYEASAFAEWKGLRLPTEFEWEVASSQFHWGERWEWTHSAYLPYPGFKKAPGAVGEYNGKFMLNQMVLRGGSAATAKNHSRRTYRNFFHAKERWQYAGIRLAR